MKQPEAIALGLALLIATVGSVAPDEADPLSQLFGDSAELIGGQEVSGPISIRDSIIGDIISINVRVNSTVRTNISAELLQIVVCALNEYGQYGIEMVDVRKALTRWYTARKGRAHGHR